VSTPAPHVNLVNIGNYGKFLSGLLFHSMSY
jgi:hypothetical protein